MQQTICSFPLLKLLGLILEQDLSLTVVDLFPFHEYKAWMPSQLWLYKGEPDTLIDTLSHGNAIT